MQDLKGEQKKLLWVCVARFW